MLQFLKLLLSRVYRAIRSLFFLGIALISLQLAQVQELLLLDLRHLSRHLHHANLKQQDSAKSQAPERLLTESSVLSARSSLLEAQTDLSTHSSAAHSLTATDGPLHGPLPEHLAREESLAQPPSKEELVAMQSHRSLPQAVKSHSCLTSVAGCCSKAEYTEESYAHYYSWLRPLWLLQLPKEKWQQLLDHDYYPAIPLTYNGLIYLVEGLLIAGSFWGVLSLILRRLFSLGKKRTP